MTIQRAGFDIDCARVLRYGSYMENTNRSQETNDAMLSGFRQIAEAMGIRNEGWEWIGKHMSQRMFGITEKRAKEYAALYGGTARQMEAAS